MFVYDRKKERLINLDSVTHIQCMEHTDHRSNETVYSISYKMRQSVPTEEGDADLGQEQLVLTSNFLNKKARDEAFTNLVDLLIEDKQLFIVR